MTQGLNKSNVAVEVKKLNNPLVYCNILKRKMLTRYDFFCCRGSNPYQRQEYRHSHHRHHSRYHRYHRYRSDCDPSYDSPHNDFAWYYYDCCDEDKLLVAVVVNVVAVNVAAVVDDVCSDE